MNVTFGDRANVTFGDRGRMGMAERIGEYLVEIGALDASQVKVVINHQKAGDQRLFGEIAMELGYLADTEPIDKFLELQEKGLGD